MTKVKQVYVIAVAAVILTALVSLGWVLWIVTERDAYCQQQLGYGAVHADSDYCHPPPVRVPDMPGWLP